MDGILLVDKPEGITSAEVVRRVKRRLRAKTGHLGTLDPFASGLLPLCLGAGTKIAPFLNEADKAYEGTIRLGVRTDSGDRTGEAVETAPVPEALDAARLVEVAVSFHGERQQVPPMYSAIKRDGRPLYELARSGLTVEREARSIVLHRIDLELVDERTVRVSVACSKGTYIRVLAEEIAVALGTVGHLHTLRRTAFGRFRIADAIALDDVEASPEIPVLSPSAALGTMPAVQVAGENLRRARQGFEPLLERLRLPENAPEVKLIDGADELVAVLVRGPRGDWRYARVFAAA